MKSTICDSIEKFLFHCRYEKHLNFKSIKAYECDLDQFMHFVCQTNPPVFINDIGKEVLKDYLKNLFRLKPRTSKRKIAVVKAMFNFLEFDDLIEINPFRKLRIRFQEPNVLPVVMTLDEVEKIFEVLYKDFHCIKQKSFYKQFEYSRNLAVVELLFATGIRVSELCGICLNDVEIKSGALKIFGKGSKERTIQIYPYDSLDRLREYYSIRLLMNHSQFLFINRNGAQLSTQSARLLIKKLGEKANISKKVRPHIFRHTFATLLLEEGVDIKYIQTFLGHSSITTTQIYTHVSNAKEKSIIINQHPRRRIEIG
jgi:integrase/recombinase XerD